VPIGDLARAIRGTGGTHDLAAVAAALDVDGDTLRVRLNLVTAGERALIVEGACDIWSVA
jgi:hypothetical protein